MSEKRDYYEVLAVERNASSDEIRRAYRALALKHHPDRNPGDASAEALFKEATEAYTVLSDQEKRASYDRFGHAGMGGGVDFSGAGIGDILSQFQDMFSDFFGGIGGMGQQRGGRRGPARGQDVRVEVGLSLKDAFTGCKQEVTVHGAAPCETCQGTGAKAGTKPERCQQCGGRGQVTSQRGFIMFSSPCGRCRGSGEVINDPCGTCRGGGFVEQKRAVLVTFPAGIDTGQRLRVPGKGMAGPGGAAPGDLYVDVEVAGDERFERQGNDLVTRGMVSFARATLGTELTVKLPDDSPVKVEIDAGSQPGTVVTVRGQGMPRVDRRGRGDLHVVVNVVVPRKVSRKAKKLLEELEDELGENE